MRYYFQTAGGALSATLGREAALARTPGPSSGSHARLGGHASGRGAPAVAVPHHPAAHQAAGPSGASSVAAPHVPAVVTPAGFSLAHRPRLLLLHVQTHLAAEHDWLREEEMTPSAHWVKSDGKNFWPPAQNSFKIYFIHWLVALV